MNNGTDIYLEGVTRPAGLLPCPFCGREPGYLARVSEHTKSGEFHALMCYCGGFASTAHQSADTQAEAVALWNGRAQSAAHPDPVAMPRKPTFAMLCALAGRTEAQMHSQACIEAGDRYDALLALAAAPAQG